MSLISKLLLSDPDSGFWFFGFVFLLGFCISGFLKNGFGFDIELNLRNVSRLREREMWPCLQKSPPALGRLLGMERKRMTWQSV